MIASTVFFKLLFQSWVNALQQKPCCLLNIFVLIHMLWCWGALLCLSAIGTSNWSRANSYTHLWVLTHPPKCPKPWDVKDAGAHSFTASSGQLDDTTATPLIYLQLSESLQVCSCRLKSTFLTCVLLTRQVKMPWPFSESIKKRACRYLLHRYLGNFLQEKLSLDQLSLDLYQGTGSLAQVPLDKWVW